MPTWFDRARFAMFVHWGHGSQRGWELSWPLVGGLPVFPKCQDVPAAEYHANARSFAPRPQSARDWLARARRAGMRYAVLTTKHHDGFALWPTRPYEIVTVRGLPIRRVRAVRELRSGTALAFRTRCTVADQLFNGDPTGELIITVPEALLDPLATVIAVDL